ncbi:MAG: deoxyguanosinetriphosphate triphosphohydrolase [Gammaproteobacteria bacterium]|nr:deoxyguanosinetriphosphate triphosphohydrolase [Gammaproteobacteria bacterium]
MNLAPYAANPAATRGRQHPESPPTHRDEFQRDRDRVIHCAAFRRLVYKTQVFVNHEGDLYRTRLTHSLEVAQIGRSIALALGLNEHLTEGICLAHDLGHTPFGHAGQDALNACMRDYGGFEHNRQSLRVVDELEDKYAAFPGLNLTFETREGILKHCSAANARRLGELGRRFLERTQPGLEAQLANLADEIAYNNHDVDDGLRSGLVRLQDLREVRLFRVQNDAAVAACPGANERVLVHETVRRMIGYVVNDCIATSGERIRALAPRSIDEVRAAPGPLVGFSDEVREQHLELKRFLLDGLYRHHRVRRMTTKAARVLTELFEAFHADPALMPGDYAATAAAQESPDGAGGRARVICDYVAGMTDRYAISEHERLFDPRITG